MKVNFAAIAAASADITLGASQIRTRLDDMDRDLTPLKQNWTGEASQAYDSAKIKWTTAITDMQELLSEIGRSVGTGGEDFQSSERGNTARWGV